jgi:hypothetical protein
MVQRLPSHVLTLVLLRLEAGEPILKIHRELGVVRSTLYKIVENLKCFGQPYAPSTMRMGPTPLLAPCHIEVCGDRHGNGVAL